MKHIFIINGPNLNLLGERDQSLYGKLTLNDIENDLTEKADKLNFELKFFQSNIEGEIISAIQDARKLADGIIINAGAYSHTSIAIRDALEILSCPIIEVHLSNIYKRESFRNHSHISSVATGVICGLGPDVYSLALTALVNFK